MAFPAAATFRNMPRTKNPEIWSGTGIHYGVIAALIAVIFAYVLLARHQLGFQIRLSGQAPKAARFAGRQSRPAGHHLAWASAGLWPDWPVLFEVTGPAGVHLIDFNQGYGFTAIIVAFLGRLNPIGILLAGLLMALTYIGGDIAKSSLGLPAAAIPPSRACCCSSCWHSTSSPITDPLEAATLMDLSSIIPVLLLASLMVASTPILLAAVGEMVVETCGCAEPRGRRA